MSVPIFKNTHEALRYGEKMDGFDWLTFKMERERLKKIIEEYKEKGDFEKALYLASGQYQFLREAQEEYLKHHQRG
jgi:hypothetical protein